MPSNNEWLNSTFFFNINNLKSIPVLDGITSKFLKMYFNMYNLNMEKKVKLKKLSRKEKLISNRKVWIDKLELKHTNDKLIINIHLYDRTYNIVSNKFAFYWKTLINNILIDKLNKSMMIISKLQNNIMNLSSIFSFYLQKQDNVHKQDINIDKLKLKEHEINKRLKQYNRILIPNILSKKIILLKKNLNNNIKMLYHAEFIINNILKYKTEFIIILQRMISKFYNKKVIFNIILLKNYYLSSEILTQILAHTTKERDNRIYWTLKKTLINIKVPTFKKSVINKANREKFIENVIINKNLKETNKISSIIEDYYNLDNNESNVLNRLKNKSIIGVRIESAGRLTRRFTAQRGIKKIKYIGTIRNIDSSFKGLSTQKVRNNISSSLQYSKSGGKNRIGSFGLKGWINSM